MIGYATRAKKVEQPAKKIGIKNRVLFEHPILNKRLYLISDLFV